MRPPRLIRAESAAREAFKVFYSCRTFLYIPLYILCFIYMHPLSSFIFYVEFVIYYICIYEMLKNRDN